MKIISNEDLLELISDLAEDTLDAYWENYKPEDQKWISDGKGGAAFSPEAQEKFNEYHDRIEEKIIYAFNIKKNADDEWIPDQNEYDKDDFEYYSKEQYQELVSLMDDEIREAIHALNPGSEKLFFEWYQEEHKLKYAEEWPPRAF